MHKKEYMSWRKFEESCRILANQITDIDYILAIGKDGLLPGSYLSDILQKPLAVIMVNSYDRKVQGKMRCNKQISYAGNISGVGLIVDSIVDTGRTLQFVKGLVKTPTKSAALYYKPRSKIKPDFFAYQIEDDVWVEFFWRRERN